MGGDEQAFVRFLVLGLIVGPFCRRARMILDMRRGGFWTQRRGAFLTRVLILGFG